MQDQLDKSIEELHKDVEEAKKKLLDAQRARPKEEIHDYVFDGWGGLVKLSELFGDQKDLIIVHNMGKECTYCTLWADGFAGVAGHFARRCAFVVASPNDVETQKQFAGSRGWKFRMVSAQGSSFTKDMGFEPQPGAYWPGYSTFSKGDDGKIYRMSWDHYGPGDNYCPIWPMLDLLADGQNGWEPSNDYHPAATGSGTSP